jgi:hypothetical protein
VQTKTNRSQLEGPTTGLRLPAVIGRELLSGLVHRGLNADGVAAARDLLHVGQDASYR